MPATPSETPAVDGVGAVDRPHPVQFFNTMGRAVMPFTPLDGDHVRMYTCGPTVYNHVHIGNLRTFVFEDLLCRTLRFLGYRVTQVMNLTDVDDKTIRGASEANLPLDDFTATYIDSFFNDLDTLQVVRADHYPRATRHIDDMITMIETLVAKEHAYVSDDGSVFFRIASDDDYGRLAGIDPSGLRQGERVASDEYDKESVRDFVLWKAAKDGEPSWNSPWGAGRPGWHIECSAMSVAYLGNSFDIHGGGVDLIFPHHENEIAQTESATGEPFVHTWLHSEHLIVDGAKMSKSLGNQYTLKDLIARGVRPRVLRYLFLQTHYRQKLNFTFDSLGAAAAALRRVDALRHRLGHAPEAADARPAVGEAAETLLREVADALADDLGVPNALAAVFNYVKAINRAIDAGDGPQGLGAGDRQRALDAFDAVDVAFGVFRAEDWPASDGEASDGAGDDGLSDADIDGLLAERQTARAARDFARADEIRVQLTEAGIVIADTPDGPRWRRGD
ncbi:MAG: cysteine--tRNA ligase [Acidobacteriota bacterium]